MGFKFWNEYVGKKFGLLKVLEIIEPEQAKKLLGLEVGRTYFACKCKCGEVKYLLAGNVKSGAVASCGSKACKAELLKLKRKKSGWEYERKNMPRAAIVERLQPKWYCKRPVTDCIINRDCHLCCKECDRSCHHDVCQKCPEQCGNSRRRKKNE